MKYLVLVFCSQLIFLKLSLTQVDCFLQEVQLRVEFQDLSVQVTEDLHGDGGHGGCTM